MTQCHVLGVFIRLWNAIDLAECDCWEDYQGRVRRWDQKQRRVHPILTLYNVLRVTTVCVDRL